MRVERRRLVTCDRRRPRLDAVQYLADAEEAARRLAYPLQSVMLIRPVADVKSPASGRSPPPDSMLAFSDSARVVQLVELSLDRLAGLFRRLLAGEALLHFGARIEWYSLACGIFGPSTKCGFLMP